MLPHLPLHKVNKFNSVKAFSSPIVSNKENIDPRGPRYRSGTSIEVSVLIF